MQRRICSLIKMKPPIANDRGLLFASGASKPTDGTDGYQAGCIFQDTTNGIAYVNEGSITSCDFNALGDLTSVDYSEGGTTAITISGAYTTGIDFTGTMTPNTSRTNHALMVGGRSTAELAVAFAGSVGAENFEPIQLNFNLTGTNPASTSTINIIQQAIYHDTDDMANLRLKCADWWVTVNKDCKDVYCIQNEINFGAGTNTASGEVSVLGLVLDGGAGTLTCPYYHGINMTMRGASTPANATGVFIRVESGATIANGIELRAEGTMTTGIRYGNISGGECPSTVFSVPAAGTGVTIASVDAAADGEGSIAIQVGNVTKYLQYWPSATA